MMNPEMDIHQWVDAIGRSLVDFSTDREIYAPIEVRIKMTKQPTDSTGTVKICVPLSDKNWANDLIQVVKEMVKRPNIDIVDYRKKSIKTLTTTELHNTTEFDVIDKQTGDYIRTKTSIEPPKRVSVNKSADIHAWFEEKKPEISDIIIDELKGNDMITLVPVSSDNGDAKHAVENYLKKSRPLGMSWKQFLKTYAENDSTKSLDSSKVASQISKCIIGQLRLGLVANQPQIKAYFANVNTNDEKLWDTGAHTEIGEPVYQNDVDMFADIVDDVLHSDGLIYNVSDIVNLGTGIVDVVTMKKKVPMKKTTKPKIDSKHPIDKYYHGFHYEKYGSLPAHMIDKQTKAFNSRVKSSITRYPGDINKVMDRFYMFAGIHSFPGDNV
ncbi:hypothetical protein OAB94_02705, partial [Flavobacteriaceae bacterium]|nr:hypothetical protein [Flavobacteriaceae bacterium]